MWQMNHQTHSPTRSVGRNCDWENANDEGGGGVAAGVIVDIVKSNEPLSILGRTYGAYDVVYCSLVAHHGD